MTSAVIDNDKLKHAVAVFKDRFNPREISLFGSRARGDASESSDWDFLVLVSEDAAPEVFSPVYAWEAGQKAGLPADVVVETEADFIASIPVANTLAREINDERIVLFKR
jgi:predicted nucleotidyltransferase